MFFVKQLQLLKEHQRITLPTCFRGQYTLWDAFLLPGQQQGLFL